MIRNPKQEGTDLFDCRPQTGKCPMNCNQCFYNRPNAYYNDINKPNIPTLEEVGDGIVRINTGHDSNLQRDLVIKTAERYKRFFFNTSIPRFDFPGPVVFTANAKEEERAFEPKMFSTLERSYLDKIMFVRLRVSTTNLELVEKAIMEWREEDIPVVLTFMAYYEEDKLPPRWFSKDFGRTCIGHVPNCNFDCYEWKVRHINSYFCPTRKFKEYVMMRMKRIGGRLVTMCGTLDSNWCRDCRNCETYYWQAVKHIKEKGK